jgi:hypothetical protein
MFMKSSVFWDITPCSLLKARLFLLPVSFWCLSWLTLQHWRWRRHVPPKRQFIFIGLQGVIFLKIELFVTTALRTSFPTETFCCSFFKGLKQMCTRFLHVCSALCKCANWICRTCTPHHTVAGRSSVSLTHSPFAFPSNCRCGPPLTSYMPGRAVPSRALVHGTAALIIARRALCTACAPLV